MRHRATETMRWPPLPPHGGHGARVVADGDVTEPLASTPHSPALNRRHIASPAALVPRENYAGIDIGVLGAS